MGNPHISRAATPTSSRIRTGVVRGAMDPVETARPGAVYQPAGVRGTKQERRPRRLLLRLVDGATRTAPVRGRRPGSGYGLRAAGRQRVGVGIRSFSPAWMGTCRFGFIARIRS